MSWPPTESIHVDLLSTEFDALILEELSLKASALLTGDGDSSAGPNDAIPGDKRGMREVSQSGGDQARASG